MKTFGLVTTNANEMLAITGVEDDVLLTKKYMFIWPWIKYRLFELDPILVEINELEALSEEKILLGIPTSVTVGVIATDPAMIMRYVKSMITSDDKLEQERYIVQQVSPIVKGEVRAVAASMSANDLVSNRNMLKEKLDEGLDKALLPYGMHMINANFSQVKDLQGYFHVQSMATTAANRAQAAISTAESKAQEQIAQQDRETHSKKQTSKLQAEQAVYENLRKETIMASETQRKTQQIELTADVEVSQIQSQMQSKLQDATQQQRLQQQNYHVTLEKLKATTLAKTVVECEQMKKQAEAKAYQIKTEAAARYFEAQKNADGELFRVIRQAQGVEKLYEAQSQGIQNLMKSLNDGDSVIQYMMMEKGVYQQLAKIHAGMLESMANNVSINTITSTGNEQLDEFIQNIPPLIDGLHDQTDIKLPEWLSKMLKPSGDPAMDHVEQTIPKELPAPNDAVPVPVAKVQVYEKLDQLINQFDWPQSEQVTQVDFDEISTKSKKALGVISTQPEFIKIPQDSNSLSQSSPQSQPQNDASSNIVSQKDASSKVSEQNPQKPDQMPDPSSFVSPQATSPKSPPKFKLGNIQAALDELDKDEQPLYQVATGINDETPLAALSQIYEDQVPLQSQVQDQDSSDDD